jgi:Predicted ATPases of PP-loop superfamily
MIDENFLHDLPSTVDACGENGEFHSFVYDGPVFKYPIPFVKGEIVYKEYKAPENLNDISDPGKNYGFYFCDLLCGS